MLGSRGLIHFTALPGTVLQLLICLYSHTNYWGARWSGNISRIKLIIIKVTSHFLNLCELKDINTKFSPVLLYDFHKPCALN